MQFDDSFHAMGTDIDVLVVASRRPIEAFISLRLLFEEQESLFSRFRNSSLLSRLNGGASIEHPRFATACRMALEAHESTGGLFNPMVLPALLDSGYDRSIEAVGGGHPRAQRVPDPRSCLVLHGDTVRLREGALDLGGIIKGWTVDLAIDLLEGVDGALINAGGDLRAAGANGWQIEVEAPGGGIAWAGDAAGALATSTTATRRWLTNGDTMAHHLIDPRTGLPSAGPAAQVSAWGTETWRAECWAKAVLIGGQVTAGHARRNGFEVLALTADGEALCAPVGLGTLPEAPRQAGAAG
ncbi:MAG TPA: FAD:protein FMN transferase [Tepidiformaceae bacterium]|nr:FAD:protein FMN transferase [Tepidiformaceae bacterium]